MNLKNVRHLCEVLATDAQGRTVSTMQSEDSGRISAQIAELQQAMMVLGYATYGGATATGLGGPERPGGGEPSFAGHGEPRDEDVVEGEYQPM